MFRTVIVIIFVFVIVIVSSIERVQATEIELGLSYLSGKHQTQSLNFALKVPIFNEAAFVSSNLRYGIHNKEIVQNRGLLRLNYDPSLTKHWSLWFYEQGGYDKPKEIDFEHFLGGGPKYILYQSDFSKHSISVGYLNHYQEFCDGDATNIHRLSFRLKARHVSHFLYLDGLEFKAVLFYQPNIEDPDDYLANGEISVAYAVLQYVRIKAYVEDYYRSVSQIPQKNEFLTGLKLVLSF